MTQPISSKNSIHSNQLSNQPVFVEKTLSYTPIKDTLRLGVGSESPSCLESAWETLKKVGETISSYFHSFVSYIKSFFGSCFSSGIDSAKIQEVANSAKFIWFYDQTNPLTSFLGNFYPSEVEVWGLKFQCAEAAYQAAKFRSEPAKMQEFQQLDGAAAFEHAKRLSAGWNQAQKRSWQTQNVAAMKEVLNLKFQNPEFKKGLLATGNSYLVEHIPVKGRDRFWGDDSDGTGRNALGQLLMELRQTFGGGAPVGKPQEYNRFLSGPR